MAGHNYRFAPSILEAREALRSGQVGLPWAIHSDWIVGAGSQAAAIGELMNHAMYPIDALLYLVPSTPQSVYCITGSYFFDNAKENNVEDLGFITMNMERGIIATTSIGRTPVPHINGYGGDMTIRVMGTHGMLYVDANRPRWVSYSRSGASAIKYGPDKLYDTVDHFVGLRAERHAAHVLGAGGPHNPGGDPRGPPVGSREQDGQAAAGSVAAPSIGSPDAGVCNGDR